MDIKRHVQCPVTLTAISIWLANGAKVGTLVVVTIVGTFLVWFELGSATTFQNLISFSCIENPQSRTASAARAVLAVS